MQAADFLQASAGEASVQFCKALVHRNPAAPPSWALLKAESAHIRNTVLGHHPNLSTQQPLADVLPQLPKSLGLRAVRLYIKRDGDDATPPALTLDTSSRKVIDEVPALLPALTELRTLQLTPPSKGEVSAPRPSADPRWQVPQSRL